MSLLLAAGSGGGGNTGSIVVTLEGATGSLTGTESFSGSVSTTLAGATVAMAGTETYSGAVSTTLAGASASLTGTVSASGVSGEIAITLEGASASLIGDSGVTGGGGYDEPKKKRFIVEKNGKLLVFSNANAAVNAIPESSPVEPVKEKPQEIAVAEVKKVVEVSRVDYLLTMKHLEALVAEYEAQRDEQEIEELLLLAM